MVGINNITEGPMTPAPSRIDEYIPVILNGYGADDLWVVWVVFGIFLLLLGWVPNIILGNSLYLHPTKTCLGKLYHFMARYSEAEQIQLHVQYIL